MRYKTIVWSTWKKRNDVEFLLRPNTGHSYNVIVVLILWTGTEINTEFLAHRRNLLLCTSQSEQLWWKFVGVFVQQHVGITLRIHGYEQRLNVHLLLLWKGIMEFHQFPIAQISQSNESNKNAPSASTTLAIFSNSSGHTSGQCVNPK